MLLAKQAPCLETARRSATRRRWETQEALSSLGANGAPAVALPRPFTRATDGWRRTAGFEAVRSGNLDVGFIFSLIEPDRDSSTCWSRSPSRARRTPGPRGHPNQATSVARPPRCALYLVSSVGEPCLLRPHHTDMPPRRFEGAAHCSTRHRPCDRSEPCRADSGSRLLARPLDGNGPAA